jgi:hypothetical protein
MIVSLTTTIGTKAGKNVWYPFEVECTSIDDLHSVLIRDHVVKGAKLETVIRDGERIILERIPVIVGVFGIVTIQPIHLALSDPIVDRD